MTPISIDGIQQADRSAYWSLPDRAGRSSAYVPVGCTFLYLDPRLTSPNVVLGVTHGGVTRYMLPGDVLPVEGGRAVGIFNANKNLILPVLYDQSPGLVGYLRLLAGTQDELAALVASKGDVEPIGTALLLYAGRCANGQVVVVPTIGLQGVRVSVRPLDATTKKPTTAPADFAATVAVSQRIVGGAWGSSPTLPAPTANDALPLQSAEEADAMTVVTEPNAEALFTFEQTQLTFDRPILAGSQSMYLTPNVTAGTGMLLTYIALFVEGR